MMPRSRNSEWWIASLIIIAVIVILIPVYLKALANAKHVAATEVARQIDQSVADFYKDHSVLPFPPTTKILPGGNLFETDTPDGLEVINMLMGYHPANTRRVRYLVVKEARNGKDGATYDHRVLRVTGLFDPWGNPYLIVLDTDYDNHIVVPLKAPVILKARRSAVYSAGPDRTLETPDDVRSW